MRRPSSPSTASTRPCPSPPASSGTTAARNTSTPRPSGGADSWSTQSSTPPFRIVIRARTFTRVGQGRQLRTCRSDLTREARPAGTCR
jgi:hypothetical protein